ncbi:alanine--glyoxylate aminotransferase family protein [Candidatus Bipolaricaulota bacterium]|nr:alanine--glyoxylate aminotransferase family protein [Candidatus Bipolaricaulota bacterium]
MKRYQLMIPGPIEVAPEVLAAMGEPLVAHYGAEWTAYYKETVGLVQRVVRTEGDVFLIPGSGSAGLDAALGSALAPSGQVLILQNGFFGERLAEIARSYTPNVEVLPFPLGQAVDPGKVEGKLREGRFDAVAVVHCETSTGVLNPVRELAEVCRGHEVLLIVDAIASLGIEPLDMDDWGVGICVSASQKGLESPPGLAVVAVAQAGWAQIDRAAGPGWYLNLKVWQEYTEKWGSWHPHPITQAVNNVRALRVGVERILAEGLEARFQRHRAITAYLRRGLRDLGLEPFVADEVASHGVTSVVGPEGRVEELLACLRDRHGLLLAGTLGELKGKVFRVGHMGPGATLATIRGLLKALEVCLSV